SDQLLPEIEELDIAIGVRNDKHHLFMSIKMAQMHAYLAIGDFLQVVKVIEELQSRYFEVEFKGYYSVNFAKALAVLYTLYLIHSDQEKCSEIIDKMLVNELSAESWIKDNRGSWLYTEIDQVKEARSIVSTLDYEDLEIGIRLSRVLGVLLRIKDKAFADLLSKRIL